MAQDTVIARTNLLNYQLAGENAPIDIHFIGGHSSKLTPPGRTKSLSFAIISSVPGNKPFSGRSWKNLVNTLHSCLSVRYARRVACAAAINCTAFNPFFAG